MSSSLHQHIPQPILSLAQKLHDAGFESYFVGGCVRDLIMGKKPKDWDITTNAHPEEIQKIFPDSFYENTFGTVGVKIDTQNEKSIDEDSIVEITTYRTESTYSDKRRPDTIQFTDTLQEDLKRRDFTMNALALSPSENTIKDFYEGKMDIEKKVIRAVGDPYDRFREDALRMMRAVRFFSQFDFSIEGPTLEAIQKNAKNLQSIAKERIRIELEKIILSSRPSEGIEM
ncbi:MAG: hypothetical protein EOM19_08380, partial [Candidatus Moranbacteria bacterium]|nr:hypothetical protein [Candidatus Moranbacteria bacterium]